MDRKGKALSETVWTRMDRKAGAIIELTMRQLRHRVSTWVVLGVGVLLLAAPAWLCWQADVPDPRPRDQPVTNSRK